MIVSFRNKALEELFRKGKSRKIASHHAAKLQEQMAVLDRLTIESDIMIYRSWRPHKLIGKNPNGQSIEGHWSLKVCGNWRLTYYFNEDGNVVLTDFIDYH